MIVNGVGSLLGGLSNSFNVDTTPAIASIDALIKKYGELNLAESTAQMLADGVGEAEAEAALVKQGYNAELVKQEINTAKTNAAKVTETGTTQALTTAERALTAAKTAGNAALKAFGGILVTVAISAFISKIFELATAEKELAQATKDSAQELQNQNNTIDDYVTQYEQLHQALLDAKGDEEETYNIKSQLLELQKQINEQYGDEYGKINLVTDAYKDQTEALKDYNKELAQSYLNENVEGIENATNKMTKDRHYNLSYTGISSFTEEGQALKEIAERYESQGMTILDEYGDGSQFSIHLNADVTSAEETINSFMNDVREKAEELGNSDLFDSVLEMSSSSLEDVTDVLDKYEDSYKNALTSEIITDNDLAPVYEEALTAIDEYNEAVLKAEDPYSDEDVAKARQNLEAIKSKLTTEEWEKYKYVIDDLFDSVDTRLYDLYNDLSTNDVFKTLKEDLNGLTDVDLSAMADDDISDSFDKLIESTSDYGVSIEELIDLLVDLGVVQSTVASEIENAALPYDWEELNDEIDSIQSAYQAVQSAQEEYNKYGYVSLDTLQALISLDSEYLSCLIDENGQLQLNNTAYQNLVQAKLAEAEASAVSQAIDELNNLQKRENIQSSYDYVEANALLAQSLSALSGSYSAVMNSAAAAAQAQALSAAIEDAQGRGVAQADIENVISNLNAKLQLIRSTSVGVTKSVGNMNNAMNGFEDSTKGATDALDEQKEALEKQKKALEKTKEELEDQQKALEDIRDEYDALYDAIQWFFDEQIDGYDDLIDNLNDANDALQEQLDNLDDILSVVNNVYGDEIDLIQQKIDALDEANDAAERELALEEARQKLEEARNSRTILQYTADRGYIYTADERAIKEAEDEVDEANAEKIKAELEDQIKLLEEMRDKWAEIPDAFEKAMQEMAAIEKWGPNFKDFILGSTEDDIADFEGEYSGIQSDMEENNNQIDYYEQQKERIEELKELWEDAKNAYENAQNEARLAAFFGSDYEYQLLNNSTMWSAKFAENYGDISAQIDALEDEIEGVDKQIDAIDEQIDALEEKIEEIKNSASGGSGSGGGGGVGGSGRGLSQYIWTEEDDHAISMGHAMLNQLNAAIDDGKIKYQESADALANYLETYEGFKNGEKSVEDLNTALAELNGVEQEYLGSYTTIIDKTTERLNDSANYTGQIVDYSATAILSFDNLNGAMDTSASKINDINSGANTFTSDLDQNVQNISAGLDNVNTLVGDTIVGRNQLESAVAETIFGTGQVASDAASNVDTVNQSLDNLNANQQGITDAANAGITDASTAAAKATTNVTALKSALGNLNNEKLRTEEVASDEINKASSAVANAATNVTALSNAMANLTTEKQELEGEVNEEVTDVSTSVTESVEKITLLKDALSGLDLAKQELENTVNSEVLDTNTLITEAQTNVTNINNAVNQLVLVVDQLKAKLNELYSTMSMLDEVTLSNVISVIGFGIDDENASLLGAIQAVINKIIGEDGLVYQLQAFNENTDLTPVITQFNGEEASLLSSIQDVINIISVDGDSLCLISTINRITETIQNITLVQNAFMSLETQVSGCIDKVIELKNEINSLEDKTITITTVYETVGSKPSGLATGTAQTGRGFATGTANERTKTGKSFLSGNWGLPYDLPKSMIAELGPEILLRDGIYKLIEKPQFIDLKKGDIIFNHEQTKAILSRGKNSNIKRLSKLGSDAIDRMSGKSFANGYNMIPLEYSDIFSKSSKLFNSGIMDVAGKLLSDNTPKLNSALFDSIKDTKLTKEYNFGDIKINMYGVNDTQSFAVEIKKNFNSILRQID